MAHLRNQFKSMNTFERSYDYILVLCGAPKISVHRGSLRSVRCTVPEFQFSIQFDSAQNLVSRVNNKMAAKRLWSEIT